MNRVTVKVQGSDEQVVMRRCLALAAIAERNGEVPIGAVICCAGQVVASAWNQTRVACDPSAHAEIVALRRAALALGNYRLKQCVLYVNLEPCVMCAGAMIQARIERVVYGCYDPRFGAFSGEFSLLDSHQHNHRLQVHGGVLLEQSRAMLQNFFQQRR